MTDRSRFASTDRYIATRDLEVAVNAAVALERPLLVKGEPGTGKTCLLYTSPSPRDGLLSRMPSSA